MTLEKTYDSHHQVSHSQCPIPIATEILKGRFGQAVTISGRLQYHAFISTQDRKLLMKKFSFSEKFDIFPKGQKKEPQKRPAKLPSKAEQISRKHNFTK